ncbi:hypothetical protein P691DRAFT_807809 [Macrolepiota fuliginosa MF-IS2]|uniref:F-box domain-containing protein n=1 Tax=Macrolepiota fuliginosa MF-IS2 TaxID=1400762 RepID=A0A9P6C7S5_9AGAR|nr:hypothetical protein P691DRAFT_807809 [Macrolepiota fuliginosa MF-IS2]
MDRCLAIPEIIHLICDGIRREGSGSKTLVQIACVSRTWSDIALDSLWYKITGMDRLIRCMPWELWLTATMFHHKKLILNRPIKISDLQLLEKYAPRVRVFHYRDTFNRFGAFGIKIPQWVQQAFFLSAHHPILPNLKEPHWAMCKSDITPFLRFFLNDRLEDLQLCIDITRMEQVYFLAFLPVLCPAISQLELTLSNRVHDNDLGDQIQDFTVPLCGWRYLTSLVITDTTLDGLLCIAMMPNLKLLGIEDARSIWRPSKSKTEGQASLLNELRGLEAPFSALQSLGVGTNEPALVITNFIRVLRNAKLSKIRISLNSELDSEGDLEDLFIALGEHCDHASLKSIRFFHSESHLSPGFSVLEPLLQFTALQSVDIDSSWDSWGLMLSKTEAAKIASAWPDVHTLSLTPDAKTPHFTLLVLLRLAKCTKLRHLSFALDASDPIARRALRDDPNLFKGVRNYSLRHLTIGKGSPISHKEFVARFLSGVFLNLDGIVWEGCGARAPEDVYAKRWMYVSRVLLPLLGRVRRKWCGSEGLVRPLKNSAREWAGKVEDDDGDWSDEQNLGKWLNGVDLN